MTFQHHDGSGSAITRLPHTMTTGQEFLRLMALKRQIDGLSSLKAQRAEIEAKRAAELLAILGAGPLPHAVMSRSQRKAMQAGVDALIDYLDAITPDCDLEPTMGFVMPGELDECEPDADGEPSLATTEHGSLYQSLWSRGDLRDLEEQCEGEGEQCEDEGADPGDREPNLGALELVDQRSWADHAYWDTEHSLGAPEIHHDQRRWSQGRGSRELDHDERGGLHSLGNGSARYLETERIRRETESLLRRKQLIPERRENLVQVRDGFAFVQGVVW